MSKLALRFTIHSRLLAFCTNFRASPLFTNTLLPPEFLLSSFGLSLSWLIIRIYSFLLFSFFKPSPNHMSTSSVRISSAKVPPRTLPAVRPHSIFCTKTETHPQTHRVLHNLCVAGQLSSWKSVLSISYTTFFSINRANVVIYALTRSKLSSQRLETKQTTLWGNFPSAVL